MISKEKGGWCVGGSVVRARDILGGRWPGGRRDSGAEMRTAWQGGSPWNQKLNQL